MSRLRSFAVCGCMLAATVSIARGQMSTEEARRRMEERAAAGAAKTRPAPALPTPATTQPDSEEAPILRELAEAQAEHEAARRACLANFAASPEGKAAAADVARAAQAIEDAPTAQARLDARTSLRAAQKALDRLADDTVRQDRQVLLQAGRVEELRKRIEAVRASIAAEKLRRAMAPPPKPEPATKPEAAEEVDPAERRPYPTFSSQISQILKSGLWKEEDARDLRRSARDQDARVSAYAKANPAVDPEIIKSMYGGRPCIGMTEEQLGVIARVHVVMETVSGKEIRAVIDVIPGQHLFTLITQKGKIVALSDKGRNTPGFPFPIE